MLRSRTPGFALAAAIFIVDQVIKAWVTGPLGIRQIGDVREIVSFFDLRFVPNIGISLGLLPADGPFTRWALVVLTGAIAIASTCSRMKDLTASICLACDCSAFAKRSEMPASAAAS